ncbi:hypothetical protein [Dyella psychrodurans]|uniref:Uncharacterized protein n=1 Tax=Dyella psychrodurans TaxID=1927960 RepID=A0A370XC03_9GAMM|nr:hypothetical protein [Dyella psychrodurans]RDS85926.1 hypothetical protein DWU99_01210 [Dyella psychrodurans]
MAVSRKTVAAVNRLRRKGTKATAIAKTLDIPVRQASAVLKAEAKREEVLAYLKEDQRRINARAKNVTSAEPPLGPNEIARLCEITHQRVAQIRETAVANGAVLQNQWDRVDERRKEVVRMHKAGTTTNEIAEHFGIRRRVVNRDLKFMGYSRTQEEIMAERDSRLEQIPKFLKRGETVEWIANEFGVYAQAITNDIALIPELHAARKAKRDAIHERRKKVLALRKEGKTVAQVMKTLKASRAQVEGDITWSNKQKAARAAARAAKKAG